MPMMVFALDEENSIINTVHGKIFRNKGYCYKRVAQKIRIILLTGRKS